MAMIEVLEFSKLYSTLEAVQDLSLRIDEGEVFGLVGSNGAGKTTLFRFLATLLEPTRGTAFVNGLNVTSQYRDVRRSIGYMPDQLGFYPGMRVWEFLDFFAASYGMRQWRRETLIADLLQLVDLEAKRNDPVETLSRGMKQRLGLAKTLVHDPPVLILDEPASGLDPRARLEVKEFLHELVSMGKTILISSHILAELADLCTSIGFIEHGRLLAHGKIEDVLAEVRTHRVYDLRLVEGADLAHAMLREDPKVFDLQTGSNHFHFSFNGTEHDASELLEAMVTNGVRVCEMREEPIDLEEAYFKMTRQRDPMDFKPSEPM